MTSGQAIRECTGYIVDSPKGRIGTVTEIRYDAEDGVTPTALVVRAGRNGTRLLVIPVSQLTTTRMPPRRIFVGGSPVIIATETSDGPPATPNLRKERHS